MTDEREKASNPFRVLAIDGGGSKGMFAVGALVELEEQLGQTCKEMFDLVYGTSVGSVIATLIATGHDAASIERWFLEKIPGIMGQRSRHQRSRALRQAVHDVLGARTFSQVEMLLGVVATRTDFNSPMIFKTSANQAIQGKDSFEPGWGASLVDAIMGSCAAKPFFDDVRVPTSQGDIPVLDGGFVANNPCLFALIDATHTLGHRREDVVALTLGVGRYPEQRSRWLAETVKRCWPVRLMATVQSANTNTMQLLISILFRDVEIVRVDESYTAEQYATSFLESEPEKLRFMSRAGRKRLREEDDLHARLQLPARPDAPTR